MLRFISPAILAGFLVTFGAVPLVAAPSTEAKAVEPAPSTSGARAPVYSVVKTVKGDSQSGWLNATSINDAGEMCGAMIGTPVGYGVIVSPESNVPDQLSPGPCGAMQVNKDGVCVGVANSQAAAWRSGKLKYFNLPHGYPVSAARAINEYGRIVGTVVDGNGIATPFVRATDGTVHLLKLPAGYESGEAMSINRAGDIVGTCDKKVGGKQFECVCVWADGVATPRVLKTPNGESCRGCKINNVGDVLGVWTVSDTEWRGCVWKSGEFVDIGAFPNSHQGNVADMNDAGDVVGWFDGTLPYLWHAGHLYKLQDLVVPKMSWGISAAKAINNRGEIVAEGGEEGGGKVLEYTVVLRPVRQAPQ